MNITITDVSVTSRSEPGQPFNLAHHVTLKGEVDGMEFHVVDQAPGLVWALDQALKKALKNAGVSKPLPVLVGFCIPLEDLGAEGAAARVDVLMNFTVPGSVKFHQFEQAGTDIISDSLQLLARAYSELL